MNIRNTQRDEYIFTERQKGRSYKDIGQEVSISAERVRQVCVQVSRDRRERYGRDQYVISGRYSHGNAEIIVYRPVLDEKERKRREEVILRALEEYGKYRVRRRMEEAAKANQNK